MPSPPIMDMGTGVDTKNTIKQLMEIEKIPIHRIEEDNERSKLEIRAWEEVLKRVQKLERSTIDLHSFAGPFNKRSIVSSDPGAITGEATPGMDNIKQDIEVVGLATKHQIKSDNIDTSEELPPGRFKVTSGEKSAEYNFKGGKISSLLSLLKTKNSKIFDVSAVRVDSEHEMLVLKAVSEGEENKLVIDDPDGLIQKIGILKIDSEEKEKSFTVKFEKNKILKTENTQKVNIKNGGSRLAVKGMVEYEISIPVNSELELKTAFEKDKPEKKVSVPETTPSEAAADNEEKIVKPVIMGPEIIVSVGDVRIKGHQIGRELFFRKKVKKEKAEPANTMPEVPEGKMGMGFTWKDGEKNVKRNVYFDTEDEIHSVNMDQVTGGKPVTGIYFFTDNSSAEFFDLNISSKTPGSGKPVPAHTIEEAKDAILKLNGVEIKRPSNSNLTDIIDGASLNLHRKTNGPVMVEAKANTEEITATLGNWVNAYNELVKFCRDNSDVSAAKDFKVDRPTEGADIADGFREIKNKSGVFASDSTIRQLVVSLQMITSQSYPAEYKPEYRVLADIGISTGDPGFENWKNNKYGLLEVNEEKLKDAINTSPLSVKDLFSSDTNDDTVVDNGVGFMMSKQLKPYSRPSGGLIALRIDLLKNRISDNKDRISKKELSLEKKEEELRRKFGAMESAIKKSKSTQGFLKNQLKSAGQE